MPGGMEGKRLAGLELPSPHELILRTATGEAVDIPWDFARHYCAVLAGVHIRTATSKLHDIWKRPFQFP